MTPEYLLSLLPLLACPAKRRRPARLITAAMNCRELGASGVR